MKICNNCSTLNTAEAVRCIQCNMPNNFTLQDLTIVSAQREIPSVICLNCGSQEPGDGEKCVQCRFPLPVPPRSGNILEYKRVQGRAKGDHY